MALSKVSTTTSFFDSNRNVVTLRAETAGVTKLLPNPNIGIFGTDDQKTTETLHTRYSSNAFEENLDEIINAGDSYGFEVHLRTGYDHTYTEGEVKSTSKEALWDLVDKLSGVQQDTGCIIDKTCVPDCSRYIEEIHFISTGSLGQGSFGKVDLCYDSETKKAFVRKTMPKCKFRANEVFVPTKICHPNITKFFGLVQMQSTLELYLEYGGFSLTQWSLGEIFDEKQIQNLSKQGLAGLEYLTDNVCIIRNNNVTLHLKITDFGSSRMPSDRLEFDGLTPAYTPPEIWRLQIQMSLHLNWGLTENDVTGKVDVFSWALVIMFMYTGFHILVNAITNNAQTDDGMDANTCRNMLIKQMAMDTDNDFFVQKLIPDECSLDMRDLLMKMTQYNHTTRVSAHDALQLMEAFERNRETSDERKVVNKTPKQKKPPTQHMPGVHEKRFNNIPVLVEDCKRTDTEPVKNSTMIKLRQKLMKRGRHNEGYTRMPPTYYQRELDKLVQDISSRKLNVPVTPIRTPEVKRFGKTLPCSPIICKKSGEVVRKILQKKAQKTTVNRKGSEVQTPIVDQREVNGKGIPQHNIPHPPHPATNMPIEESGDKPPGNLPNLAYLDP